MDKIKVVMVTSEAEPFAKTGGLGDVLGALPKALSNLNIDVRVIMPLYRIIPQQFKDQMQHIGHIFVDVNWRHQYCGVFSLVKENVTYYFIDNEFYFGSNHLYDQLDLERYSFLSYCAFEILPFIHFQPDIMHIHDWHTGAIAALFDYRYKHLPFYEKIKIVYTIHNLQYQGKFDVVHVKDMLPLSNEYYHNPYLSNFMEMGIQYSHAITTVSPSYKEEIKTPQFGEGLHELLQKNDNKLIGILNGIDYKIYSPERDSYIPYKFNENSYKQFKPLNKEKLLKEVGITNDQNAPLIGIVTRLATQKGIDLIIDVLEELLQENVNIILLGSGDKQYEQILTNIAKRYPQKMKAILRFDNAMAHKIYASSDLFLMPSIFEPCGLAQMICLKYGTLPVVREVGGLKDTIHSYNEFMKTGNGFSFTYYNSHDFLYTIRRAISIYYNKDEFNHIIDNALSCDFSWNSSAMKYKKIYENLKNEK